MNTYELMTGLNTIIGKEISVFPYSNSYISTLGGQDYSAVLFVIGLDKKETWSNGIFENSRYVRFHIGNSPKGLIMECFTNNLNYSKFRKDNTIPEIKFRKFTGTSEKLLLRLRKDIDLLVNRME